MQLQKGSSMVAKSTITKAEIFRAIEEYVFNVYGIKPRDLNIHTTNGLITDASFKFEVPTK